MSLKSRAIRLRRRSVGVPTADNFEFVEQDLPAPGGGEVLVRNLWMSVDPYMRGRMYAGDSYIAPFEIGQVLEGDAIGEVVASRAPELAAGDLVRSQFGWREAFVAPASALSRLPGADVPPQAFLGILGMPGLTAYAGVTRVIQPRPGDTIFVSGAAGAVGSAACQIAKLAGATVVASAGTDEKCAWLRTLGVDETINYKTCGGLTSALREAAPAGLDAYFDNVGGDHLQAALACANDHARFAQCGLISGLNATAPTPGPTNLALVITKRIRIQGFIVFDFDGIKPEFEARMAGWIASGAVKWEETVEHGLDRAVAGLLNLFAGANTGKMLIKLS